MDFASWVIIGLVTGWLTGNLLTGSLSGPTIDIVMGIAGALGGGLIMAFASSPAHGGLAYTGLGAALGASILTAITAYASGRKRWV